MMRSMYSGVSSLRAHQLRMDVIGNNIANVNTVGFKASNVTFAETFSQTIQGASSSSDSRGGTNPKQVGLGAAVSSITVNHSRGAIQRTDAATDLMIDGNGFFRVASDSTGQNVYYTRAGNFSLDSKGFLVTTDGMFVLDKNNKPIQVDKSKVMDAKSTTGIKLSGNISADLSKVKNDKAEAYTLTSDVYDSIGRVKQLNFRFQPLDPVANGDPNRRVEVFYKDAAGNELPNDGATPPKPTTVLTLTFGPDGRLATPFSAGPANITIPSDGLASPLVIPLDLRLFYNADDLTNPTTPKAGVKSIITQFGTETTAVAKQEEGMTAGTVNSFNISAKGEVNLIYTNGEQSKADDVQTIGLADFDNPPGLLKLGGNLFQETPNSGQVKTGVAAAGSFGTVAAGSLEMSNVDIAAQFTDMITTQRGFQANSRVITTSDEILQELVNLKR